MFAVCHFLLRSIDNEQTSEVEAIRTVHGRRLARLKSILTGYRLVKKQLRLYEDDYLWSVVLVITCR